MEDHSVYVDGDEVAAVRHAPDGTSRENLGWIFFSHGFVSDKTGSYEGRCERAAAEGYNAVRFDHRGCGESDLGFDEQNLATRTADLRAVVDHFGAERYVVFGSSFGGKVAFHVAAEDDRAEAVAVRAPVTYNDTFDGYATGDFGEALEARPFSEVVESLDVPAAVFHGRDDETVPVGDSFRAVEAVGTDVVLHVYADEGHLFSREAEERMRNGFFSWLECL